jgi:hypothetical protein
VGRRHGAFVCPYGLRFILPYLADIARASHVELMADPAACKRRRTCWANDRSVRRRQQKCRRLTEAIGNSTPSDRPSRSSIESSTHAIASIDLDSTAMRLDLKPCETPAKTVTLVGNLCLTMRIPCGSSRPIARDRGRSDSHPGTRPGTVNSFDWNRN